MHNVKPIKQAVKYIAQQAILALQALISNKYNIFIELFNGK